MNAKFVAVVLACILISQPINYALAHNAGNPTDPPGASAPKIKVTVTLDSIKLNQNMDDPTDEGVGELVLSYAFNHLGHDQSVSGHREIDFNYMVYTLTKCYSQARPDKYWMCYRFIPHPELTFRNPIKLYEHTECTPMSQMAYSFDIRESDQSTANTVASGAFTVAGAIAAIPAVGWVTAGFVAAAGSLATLIIGLNGDEHLGVQLGIQNAPQTRIVTQLNGADGGAEVRWSVKTEQVPDPEGQCASAKNKQVGSLLDGSNRQQNQYALAETVDRFISASKETLLLNPSSQKEAGLTETSDSEFEALKKETPSSVVAFTGGVYDILASNWQSDTKSNADGLSKEANSLALQKKYDAALDTYGQAMYELVGADVIPLRQDPEIPGWIKQNAEWWSDGTISDRDFASGIAFLVKEGIISSNVPTGSDGTILISDNLSIPSWIKTNAKWWADGTITDSDFTSGIQYMVDSKIISFSGPAKRMGLAPGNFEALYVMSKRGEAVSSSLIDVNRYEREAFQDLVDHSWEQYDKTRNPSDLKAAQKYDGMLKNIEKRLQALAKTENLAKQNTQNLVKTAAKEGIQKVSLEKAAAGKVFSKIKLDSSQKLAQALRDAESANKQNAKDLEKTLKLPQGAMLDTLLWNAGESGKPVDSKKLDQTFENNRKFFEDYYSIPDHLPVKAVFVDNWTILVDAHRDAQEIKGAETVEIQPDEHEAIPDNTQPVQPEEQTEPEETGRQVAVLVIGGKYYPLSQFVEVPAHTPNCDAIHYHSEFQNVYSIDGTAISDPSPSTCGFGKVGLLPVDVVTMTQGQVDAFAEMMGFEP